MPSLNERHMELEQNELGDVHPKHLKDDFFFNHCAGLALHTANYVSIEWWEECVWPLLQVHGYVCFSIEQEPDLVPISFEEIVRQTDHAWLLLLDSTTPGGIVRAWVTRCDCEINEPTRTIRVPRVWAKNNNREILGENNVK